MPILVKGDDVISETKAKGHNGRVQLAQESMDQHLVSGHSPFSRVAIQ